MDRPFDPRDVYEYANTHLIGYRTRETPSGTQIIAPYCPICGGGDGVRRDKWTFAICAESGLANCKRGSCGWTGTLHDLTGRARESGAGGQTRER